MRRLYLDRKIIENKNLSSDGLLAYVSLRIFYENDKSLISKEISMQRVSCRQLSYLITKNEFAQTELLKSINNGIVELYTNGYLSVKFDMDFLSYIISFKNLYLEKEDIDTFYVYVEQLEKIFQYKFDLLKTFLFLNLYCCGNVSINKIAKLCNKTTQNCEAELLTLEKIGVVKIDEKEKKTFSNYYKWSFFDDWENTYEWDLKKGQYQETTTDERNEEK